MVVTMTKGEPRVLILGGTAEGRALAQALVGAGIDVESSLAGRVSRPRLPEGRVRSGGFGGADGLAAYCAQQGITHLVDATHPFATTMTAHAVAAGEQAGVPVLRLARPGWRAHPLADSWHWVSSYDEARERAEEVGGTPFITTGRQTLTHYASWAGRDVLVRVVEPLDGAPPAGWTVLEDRGPYTIEGERAVMRRHDIEVVLTKDSGGAYTAAKLDAAAELGIPVIVVARPAIPSGADEVSTVAEVVSWLGEKGD